MLTQDEILKSVVIQFSSSDDCFVATSKLWSANVGCGDTPDQAQAEFASLLTMQWADYTQGNHAISRRKVGRPAKGKVSFNTRLEPTLRDELESIASFLKCSKGEVIEALVKQYGQQLKNS